MELKLRILNQFGASEPLGAPDDISAHFPYTNADTLQKRMTWGAVKILNDVKGEISVELSQFDLEGMPLGDKQSFAIRIHHGSKYREAIFTRCLNVRTMNVDGQPRKVIER